MNPRHVLRRDPRRRFLKEMPKGSVCAEIGVWKGDFSAQILRVVQPACLHLIDPWKFMTGEQYRRAWYGGKIARSQADMDAIYEAVLDRFRKPIEREIVSVHRSDSAGVASTFPDEHFDWVYIDGNHLFEFVERDLDIFWPKVRRNGVLAGDDYGSEGWWDDGVKRAVDQFVASQLCHVMSLGDQFALRRPELDSEAG